VGLRASAPGTRACATKAKETAISKLRDAVRSGQIIAPRATPPDTHLSRSDAADAINYAAMARSAGMAIARAESMDAFLRRAEAEIVEALAAKVRKRV
jgi:hypothetical protein